METSLKALFKMVKYESALKNIKRHIENAESEDEISTDFIRSQVESAFNSVQTENMNAELAEMGFKPS